MLSEEEENAIGKPSPYLQPQQEEEPPNIRNFEELDR